ncbi:paraquat-inducible protein A [Allopusillimonas ginsengisoli]|uniref:paraquat-inducible protein A n=1 Tax=Allopusillimonas ginsengisoli TaxID=453575 RepID=UPI0010C1D4A6|nr:paraquat-inducible membrane protein A [Allopusillimonas ginsengisoli]
MTEVPLIGCSQCGTIHERVRLENGVVAACRRCGAELYRQSTLTLNSWLALVVTGLVVFAIANLYPIATLRLQGMVVEASLPHALYLTWQQGHRTLSIMTGLVGFWMPLTQLVLVFWALSAVRSRRLPSDFSAGMRLLKWSEPWSMIPVLMLGVLVAMVKFSGIAVLTVGPATWAFAVLAFIMTALSRLSAHRLWHYAEDAELVPVSGQGGVRQGAAQCASCGYLQPAGEASNSAGCQRCGAPVYFRKPHMFARVWALVIAACVVYIPANVLPVMGIRTPTGVSEHTILGGVIEFWRLGSWDLAIIVFVASVVVPGTKLLVLILLMLRRRWNGASIQRQRTRQYEFINFIGHWSMLDVFVVILMTSMANFPGVSQVVAGPGAASFGMVVVLTMLAAASYDPRRGWDNSPGSSVIGVQTVSPADQPQQSGPLGAHDRAIS